MDLDRANDRRQSRATSPAWRTRMRARGFALGLATQSLTSPGPDSDGQGSWQCCGSRAGSHARSGCFGWWPHYDAASYRSRGGCGAHTRRAFVHSLAAGTVLELRISCARRCRASLWSTIKTHREKTRTHGILTLRATAWRWQPVCRRWRVLRLLWERCCPRGSSRGASPRCVRLLTDHPVRVHAHRRVRRHRHLRLRG